MGFHCSIMQGNIYGGLKYGTRIRRIVSGEQAWIGSALYGDDIASCIEDFGDDFYTNMIKQNKNRFWKDVFLSWQFVCYNNTRWKMDKNFQAYMVHPSSHWDVQMVILQ